MDFDQLVKDTMVQRMMASSAEAASIVDWDDFVKRLGIMGQRPEIQADPSYVSANKQMVRMARLFQKVGQEWANQCAEAQAIAAAKHNRN